MQGARVCWSHFCGYRAQVPQHNIDKRCLCPWTINLCTPKIMINKIFCRLKYWRKGLELLVWSNNKTRFNIRPSNLFFIKRMRNLVIETLKTCLIFCSIAPSDFKKMESKIIVSILALYKEINVKYLLLYFRTV